MGINHDRNHSKVLKIQFYPAMISVTSGCNHLAIIIALTALTGHIESATFNQIIPYFEKLERHS